MTVPAIKAVKPRRKPSGVLNIPSAELMTTLYELIHKQINDIAGAADDCLAEAQEFSGSIPVAGEIFYYYFL